MSHQAGGVDFSTGGDDFGFTDPLLLGRRRKRSRYLGTEDNILDEDTFNRDAPLVSSIADNFGNFKGDGFPLGNDALDSTRPNYVTKGGLGSLDEGLAKVGDAEGSAIWIGDLEVDDRVAIDRL